MRIKFASKNLDYDGSQLRSHFALDEFGMAGDCVVSFIGAAAVKEHMVDMEDKSKGEFIYSDRMLHFIIEHFDADLEKAILRKRLFLSLIMDEMRSGSGAKRLFRKDNGLYDGSGKLTVAVATSSPVSTLIHIGLNITREGAPVKVSCLKDYGIDPRKFAMTVMRRYHDEISSVSASRVKVKSVI